MTNMQHLLIQRAPIGISLQDSGRRGYLRYGVSEAGPMDWARHEMANQMLGKEAGSTSIEVGPAGLGLGLDHGRLQLAFAGPGFILKLGSLSLSSPVRLVLSAGESLEIIPRRGAMWGYLAVQGIFDLPELLGSQAENSVSGLAVQPVREGVRLGVKSLSLSEPEFQQYMDPLILDESSPIGILPSSQYEHFSESMHAALSGCAVSISNRFDRMAYRLENLNLSCQQGHDILSDGITMGAIQVPGDGRPFVLMADHQPTGGYPKIACVCKADLPRLAQMFPGRVFEFAWLNHEQATQRWQDVRRQIKNLQALSGVVFPRQCM